MYRFRVGIMMALLLMSGCGQDNRHFQMPNEMPEDFNFSVSFGYGEVNKNEINTYEHTVTKDLIMNGAAKAKVAFSEEEIQGIYDKMKAINVMDMDEIPQQAGCSQKPSSTDRWSITMNGQTKTLSWTDEDCKVSEEEQQLWDLRIYIQQIVDGKDAYKALPEAVGGYD